MEEKIDANNQAKLIQIKEFAKRTMPKLPYHNFSHVLDVYSVAKKYSFLNNLNEENQFLLESAVLLHDIIYVPFASDNEEKSAEFAGVYLARLDYSKEQINKIKGIILATKLPQKPLNLLEKIICDADLDHFGRKDFFEMGDKFRTELELPSNREWFQGQLHLLKNHNYHTETARMLRDPWKLENIKRLEKILHKLEDGEKC